MASSSRTIGKQSVTSDSTELRLERNKRIGNLRLEYLERLYDRAGTIFDRDLYRHGRDELHLHFKSIRPFCAVFRADPGERDNGLVNGPPGCCPPGIASGRK